MKNSGASSSDPKGKRPLAQEELETIEKLSHENNRVKRIKLEAEIRDVSYEDCKVIVDLEEAELVEKQAKQETDDEMLAKALSQILEEEQSNLVNRQIQDDEAFAKFVAQQEQDESPIFAISSEDEDEDLNVPPLRRRNRDAVGGSNMPESSSDESSNS